MFNAHDMSLQWTGHVHCREEALDELDVARRRARRHPPLRDSRERPDRSTSTLLQRKTAILQSATDHFGRYGFRGASLRDIAQDAGVSLTLLNHHFGSKGALLAAVIESHHELLDERIAAIQRVCRRGPGSFTVLDLVRAWIRTAVDAAARPEGLRFLRLFARMIDDPEDGDVGPARERLDDARVSFIEALLKCYPQASRRAATLTCLSVSAALLKVLVSGERVRALAGAERPVEADADERLLERLLVGGIEAALGSSGKVAATQAVE